MRKHNGTHSTPPAADEQQVKGPAEMLLAASAARRFYLEGRSKVEIAEEFGLSRFKVARILDLARDSGIVRIDIRLPGRIDAELSGAVQEACGLRRAIVVGTPSDDQNDVRRQLGSVAADLLTEIAKDDDVLGLAWGRTLHTGLAELTRLPQCTIVQINGVYSQRIANRGVVETVQRAADVSGGRAYPIYAPLILPDPDTARVLRSDPGISAAFAWFGRITKAVVSIGAWQEGSSTVYDALDPATRADYRKRGVRAEMSTHLFDADGAEVRTGLADRVLTISTEELRRIPEVIALAGGAEKAEAIDTVLRSGLVSTLITDAGAARRLLSARERV